MLQYYFIQKVINNSSNYLFHLLNNAEQMTVVMTGVNDF